MGNDFAKIKLLRLREAVSDHRVQQKAKL